MPSSKKKQPILRRAGSNIRIGFLTGTVLAFVFLLVGVGGVQALEGRAVQTCQGDLSWIEGHIQTIRSRLIAEGKNCQLGGINAYKVCLARQAHSGFCQPEAIENCADYLESVIAAMPEDPMGGSGLEGDSSYAWEVDEMTFSYEGRGGAASGKIHIKDDSLIDYCNYMIDIVFNGSFDYESCSFQGTGSYSWTCQVSEAGGRCLVCGEQGEIAGEPGTWTAELKDNEIHGRFWAGENNGAGFTVKLGEPGDYSDVEFSGFQVNLSCSPMQPEEEQEVSCTAKLRGANQNEDLEYMWYVDSAKEADTRQPTWTWASAEKGVHDITVYVQGEGRDTESTVTIEVGEERELVRVEGAKANETLSYRWFVDGNLLCETAACTWGEAPKGGHVVQLEVRGEGERIAVGQREFDVVTLVDEETAGFRIVVLGCNSGVSSDDTLACSL